MGSNAMFSKVLTLLFIATSVTAAAQQPPAGTPPVRTAEQQYKNIKVLTGTPANQLNITMHAISGELGVDCVHCHVWEEWDKDVKAAKEIARRMISMVRQMNQTYFGGAPVITCYSCHRSSARPVNVAVLPDTIGLRPLTTPPPPLPVEEKPKPVPNHPSVDAILQKYVQALGGEQAIRRVTSRVITARRDLPAGPAGLAPVLADVEIYQKAPNLSVMISRTAEFTVSEGFDGDVAWSQNAAGVVTTLPNPDQQRAKRAANFYGALDLAVEYASLEVTGIERVNGREAYVLAGRPPGDSIERLYFDVKTGLLLRRWSTLPTSLGRFPYQVDYDDYRKTGSGVRIPFTIRTVPGTPRAETITNSTYQVLRVRENVEIDSARFVRPETRPRPASN
ncbi:MAG: photosynthetic reaction center cytochrome c subunit [Acidobacteria bacterium]|nr:photosynthetic reaction center cytochrome c subunit [Acidobacteriota bacterium]